MAVYCIRLKCQEYTLLQIYVDTAVGSKLRAPETPIYNSINIEII